MYPLAGCVLQPPARPHVSRANLYGLAPCWLSSFCIRRRRVGAAAAGKLTFPGARRSAGRNTMGLGLVMTLRDMVARGNESSRHGGGCSLSHAPGRAGVRIAGFPARIMTNASAKTWLCRGRSVAYLGVQRAGDAEVDTSHHTSTQALGAMDLLLCSSGEAETPRAKFDL